MGSWRSCCNGLRAAAAAMESAGKFRAGLRPSSLGLTHAPHLAHSAHTPARTGGRRVQRHAAHAADPRATARDGGQPAAAR